MLKRWIPTILILFGGLLVPFLTLVTPVGAQARGVCTEVDNPTFLGLPTWYKYLDKAVDSAGDCSIQFELATDASKILLAVFEIILRIGGIVAVGFIIYGGFQYIISQGEPERTKGAKSTILNAVIGLAIAISATAIVNLIGRNIT